MIRTSTHSTLYVYHPVILSIELSLKPVYTQFFNLFSYSTVIHSMSLDGVTILTMTLPIDLNSTPPIHWDVIPLLFREAVGPYSDIKVGSTWWTVINRAHPLIPKYIISCSWQYRNMGATLPYWGNMRFSFVLLSYMESRPVLTYLFPVARRSRSHGSTSWSILGYSKPQHSKQRACPLPKQPVLQVT